MSKISAYTPLPAPRSDDLLLIVDGNRDPGLVSALPFLATLTGGSAQVISSVTPAAVTNLSAFVASWNVYRLHAVIPYSSAVTAGTPVFSFTGPGSVQSMGVEVTWKSGIAVVKNGIATSLTDANFTGPVLASSSALCCEMDGIIRMTSSGTLQLQAQEGTSGDSFTISVSAYLEVTEVTVHS